MKLFVNSFSPSSSIIGSETETLDHFFRVSNLSALQRLFDQNPEKVNLKEPKA